MPITVAHIHRYPIKGMSRQALERVDLAPGAGLPEDRRFAIAHGASEVDPVNPTWKSKRHFLTLMAHQRLATLGTAYDADTGTVVITRDGKPVARGQISTPLGKDLINQFLAAYLKEESLGMPRLVEAPGVAFTDVPDPYVSIINLATVRDIERVTRQPVDPVRFRGNLLIEGAAAWAEQEWVGRTFTVGGVKLHVAEPIGRCAATMVNPATAQRDINMLKVLLSGFGHTKCGIYTTVMEPGTIAVGDELVGLDD
ncbi:MAG: MOSC domain-containing protein [Rhodospirillaceae bacterium]|nr:MOSC domain-containing protein [Rhodospirillaceae bacterium]